VVFAIIYLYKLLFKKNLVDQKGASVSIQKKITFQPVFQSLSLPKEEFINKIKGFQ